MADGNTSDTLPGVDHWWSKRTAPGGSASSSLEMNLISADPSRFQDQDQDQDYLGEGRNLISADPSSTYELRSIPGISSPKSDPMDSW